MANQLKHMEKKTPLALHFSLAEAVSIFVPLGVHGYPDQATNAYFNFNYHLFDLLPDSLLFEISASTGESWYHYNFKKEEIRSGRHQISWDGFDQHGIYDSCRFNHQFIEARLTAVLGGQSKTLKLRLHTTYKTVDWLDLHINRHTRKITGTWRTNFEKGSGFDLIKTAVIPESTLKSFKKAPLSAPTKRFEELRQLAIAGLQYHWGRNELHPEAKSISIKNHGIYQFFLKVDHTEKNAIKSPQIVFQTNARLRRSRNWEFSRLLFYQVGYLKKSGKWRYCIEKMADEEFKYVAAHEIGHEILLAYGGHLYSKTHKKSATLLTQRPLGNRLYPQQGEIDLMLYYAADGQHPFPRGYYERSVAAEEDVRSLLWLNKVEILAL